MINFHHIFIIIFFIIFNYFQLIKFLLSLIDQLGYIFIFLIFIYLKISFYDILIF